MAAAVTGRVLLLLLLPVDIAAFVPRGSARVREVLVGALLVLWGVVAFDGDTLRRGTSVFTEVGAGAFLRGSSTFTGVWSLELKLELDEVTFVAKGDADAFVRGSKTDFGKADFLTSDDEEELEEEDGGAGRSSPSRTSSI